MSSNASEARRLRPDQRKRSKVHDISNHKYSCWDEQALLVDANVAIAYSVGTLTGNSSVARREESIRVTSLQSVVRLSDGSQPVTHRTSPHVCSALGVGRGRARLRAHKLPSSYQGLPAPKRCMHRLCTGLWHAGFQQWCAVDVPRRATCSGVAAHTARRRAAGRGQPPLLQRPLPVLGGRGVAAALCIQTGGRALPTAARLVCSHSTRTARLLLLCMRALPVPWCWERRGIGGCYIIRRVHVEMQLTRCVPYREALKAQRHLPGAQAIGAHSLHAESGPMKLSRMSFRPGFRDSVLGHPAQFAVRATPLGQFQQTMRLLLPDVVLYDLHLSCPTDCVVLGRMRARSSCCRRGRSVDAVAAV
jgi:hypothetical protein